VSKEKFFVINQNCDGEWGVSVYDTIDEVVKRFDINAPIDDYREGFHPANNFKPMLDDTTEGCMLIRGTLLLPKPSAVITRYAFEEADE